MLFDDIDRPAQHSATRLIEFVSRRITQKVNLMRHLRLLLPDQAMLHDAVDLPSRFFRYSVTSLSSVTFPGLMP